MFASEVSKKYANALFLSLKERGLVEVAHDEFRVFKKLVDKDRSLLNLLAGPQLPVEEKISLVRRVFGGRMHQLHVEFLSVLIRKRRISYLQGIIEGLLHLIEEAKGISRATVITAVDFSPAEQERLVKQLEARTGNTILLEKRVDQLILGGMIVRLHNEMIDGSVQHGLDLLGDQLAKLRVH